MLALLAASLLAAQPMATSSNDSQAFLRQLAETRKFMSGRPVSPEATPDGRTVLFLRSGPTSNVQSLFAYDVASGQTRELLTAEGLLSGGRQTLTDEEKAALERMRISARGFTFFRLSQDGQRVLVGLSGKLYVVELAGGRTKALAAGPGAFNPQFSPDGKHVAYVRENDVWAVELATNRERRITRGGTPLKTHGLAEFVAQEEMKRFSGFWWSPDSKSIVFTEADSSGLEMFSIVDPIHPEQGADTVPYPRPGKANAVVRLGVTSASGRGQVKWVKWDSKRYPYLATVVWKKKAPLTLLVQNREQTEEVLLSADVRTGATRTLLTEKNEKWLNLDQDFPLWREDGTGFFWMTERNGAPEVELRGADGTLKASWVKKEAGFEKLAGYDDATRTLYFAGRPTPTESYVWRVKEGGAPERIATPEKGEAWQVAELGGKGSLLLVNSTTMRTMPRTWVLQTQGTQAGELPEVAHEPPLAIHVQVQKVGEGEGFWTAVFRPQGFKAGQKLPVIVDTYGGPGHVHVRHAMRDQLMSQWYANQGFLVVKADGRGTPGRGVAWERAIKGDFAGPTLEDQAAALKAVAKVVPEADLSRVGITGWSFGGYMSALAVLARPDVFHVGVAGAPVTEWYDYDTHYTERYLGVPEGEEDAAYARSSLLPMARGLKRPLLLIHGTADDNVYFFHTLKLSDALFRAGRPHDVLPLSNFTHMVADPLVTERLYSRVADYFRQHLQGPTASAAR